MADPVISLRNEILDPGLLGHLGGRHNGGRNGTGGRAQRHILGVGTIWVQVRVAGWTG